jgi:hypothetical protein
MRALMYAGLTLATIVVLLIAGAIYIGSNLKVSTVHRPGGDDVSIQLPGGQMSIRARENLDPAALGIPIYPDAKRQKESGGATFEWTSRDGREDKALSVAGAHYVTSDTADQVVAWYREHLPNWIVSTHNHGDRARFELSEGGFKRLVSVQEKSDGTHIGVATIGKPASN